MLDLSKAGPALGQLEGDALKVKHRQEYNVVLLSASHTQSFPRGSA